ncbi:MAG: radical SAM protein [Armatimonadota bacterium]|nr:radical SAM protein [Armatimonadota bacterium]
MADKSIVLVNPNQLTPGVPPIALDYLAAACKSKGITADVLDLCYSADSQADIEAFLRDRAPDLIGVTLRNLDDIHCGDFLLPNVKTIVDRLKKASNAPIVLGGSGFSIAPERILDYCGVDLGVAGEGEEALPMLVEKLGDVSAYPSIPGLVYRNSGSFARNPVGQADPASLPIAKRGHIDYGPYISENPSTPKTTAVQAKRGCGQNCIYCIVPRIEGTTVRLRPVEHIVDEIESIVGLGIKSFWFADSEFNCPEEHAKSICREMIARGLPERITWMAYTSPKPFSRELAELMKQAGCSMLFSTIDHGADQMLERLNKDFRTEDIRDAVKAARDAGMKSCYSLMLGAPGETFETLQKAAEFLLTLRPIKIPLKDPQGFRIYPNSPLADIVREEGFSRKNRSLAGKIEDNEDLLRPVFYFSGKLGPLASAAKLWRRIAKTPYRCAPR